MHLPEHRWIELVDELLYRLADQALAFRRHHARVFRVRLKIAHLLHRDGLHILSPRAIPPAQVLPAAPRRIREIAEKTIQVGRRRAHSPLYALNTCPDSR